MLGISMCRGVSNRNNIIAQGVEVCKGYFSISLQKAEQLYLKNEFYLIEAKQIYLNKKDFIA